jgi:ATP-dependent Clp protease ATP-binding subunit ClpX
MTAPRQRPRRVGCAFCGRKRGEVRKLIPGPSVCICSDCVRRYRTLVTEEREREDLCARAVVVPKPREIKAALDQYVVGQEQAKKTLAVAVHNHYKRQGRPAPVDVDLQKANVLLIGPTGSGKTLLAQTLARLLRVPFAIADATRLTEAGYVGEDVETILLPLLRDADHDLRACRRGIVFIDEIDKIGRRTDGPSLTRDVSGEGVQQALLTIIEGTTARVPPNGGRKHPAQDFIEIDTTGILFICGGSFVGLEDVVRRRTGGRRLGFGGEPRRGDERSTAELLREVEPQDLVRFGLIPELVGRLPVVVALEDLDAPALVRVLTEPKNALTRQYQKLLEMEGVELRFTEAALAAIAREALKRRSGARGLRAILENVMLDVMYDVPSRLGVKEVIVSEAVVGGAPADVRDMRRTA